MNNLAYRIAFSSVPGIKPELATSIIGRIGSEEQFFKLTESQLSAAMGFKSRIFSLDLRTKLLNEAQDEEIFVSEHSIIPTYFTDDNYPHRLLECEDAPLMLYALGNCDLNDSRFISIVGTRHATAYGTSFVEQLVADLAAKLPDKPVIVSGLAYGIDLAAHKAAMKNGLPTIAVLAHGLNTIYPANHRQVAVDIVKTGGSLLTDYRSQDQIHRGNFLARNRIVAGLCDTLVVAESASRGGALVTARLASGYNREVMALPGRYNDKYSCGCNTLISSNIASLITSADDLIAQMGWTATETGEGSQGELSLPLTPEEQAVMDILNNRGEAMITDFTSRIDIPLPRMMALLIDMEFRSLISHLPGGRYIFR